jgi:hypothetical protein
MKNITIFAFWILTVALGSIIFGIAVTFIEGNSGRIDDTFGIIGISAMLSFLFSIPAIIAFLIANTRYQKQFKDSYTYRSKMYSLHLVTGGIYALIAIFIALFNGADMIGVSVILGLLLSYLPVGMICWYLGFRITSKKHIITEDVLDNI